MKMDEQGPWLFKCTIRVRTWENKSSRHGEPLINPGFLEEINNLISKAKQKMCEITVPGFPEECRLLPAENFELLFLISDLKEKIRIAKQQLAERLTEEIGEARSRLGDKFDPDEYPDEESLKSAFSIEFSVEKENPVSARKTLGKYAKNYRKREPDMWDAIEWGRKLEEAMKKPPEERKLPEWPDVDR